MADGSYVIIAEFRAPGAHRTEFLDLCRFDSTRSVHDEPGCQQFDVLTVDAAPDAVVLYEVYDDEAAFDAHKRTPHYATFAEGVARLGIATKEVRVLTRRPG